MYVLLLQLFGCSASGMCRLGTQQSSALRVPSSVSPACRLSHHSANVGVHADVLMLTVGLANPRTRSAASNIHAGVMHAWADQSVANGHACLERSEWLLAGSESLVDSTYVAYSCENQIGP
jgi:hypothetical protein